MPDRGDSSAAAELRSAEERVQARSAVFKKELGLTDLVLTQILFIIGLGWVGAAAKLGPSHIVFWLLAIVFFYLPTAAVVIHLNRLMPLEGGLYQWAKLGFGELVGFMVAWNLWLYVIVLTSEIGLIVATNLSYAIGPSASWMAGSRWVIVAAGTLVTFALVFVSMLGLRVGKWVHNAGGGLLIVIFVALVTLPIVNLAQGNLTSYRPFAVAMPTLSLFSLNILGKLGSGALGGFEYVAIFAGECRNPERTIGRSVVIAAPLIALMFILGTSSVLAFLRPDQVDLIGPIPQVLSVGTRPFGIASEVIPVVILSMLGLRLAQASINFTANTRLPMVAGWDRLLPEWFTRLHPKYRTPVNSILFVGATTLGMGLLGIVGVGHQEAFQLFQNAAGTFYALTYLVMFALPIIGFRGVTPRPSLWLRIACASGFLMTLLYVVVSVFPIIEVESRGSFAFKIAGVIVGANVLGASIFLIAQGRRGRPMSMPSLSAAALENLAARFASATIPKTEWTHRTHLAVGMWHVRRYGPEEALERLRTGIRRLNDAHGTPNSDTHGYHETVTRAYVLLLADFLAAGPPDTPLAERLQALLASPLAAKDVLFTYYSRQRLQSAQARARWEEPDLAPLRISAATSP